MDWAQKNSQRVDLKRTLKYVPTDPAREMKLQHDVRVIEGLRKKQLLRGNGNIYAYYDPVDGRPSSYQQQFRPFVDTAQC